MKKKMKNEKKKNGAGTEMGYYPNCIVTKGLGSWAQALGVGRAARAGTGALGARASRRAGGMAHGTSRRGVRDVATR